MRPRQSPMGHRSLRGWTGNELDTNEGDAWQISEGPRSACSSWRSSQSATPPLWAAARPQGQPAARYLGEFLGAEAVLLFSMSLVLATLLTFIV